MVQQSPDYSVNEEDSASKTEAKKKNEAREKEAGWKGRRKEEGLKHGKSGVPLF